MIVVRLPVVRANQVAHGHTVKNEEGEVCSMSLTPEELSCPITFKLMTDPVVAEDGQTYQRQAIEQWINKCIAGKSQSTSCIKLQLHPLPI
jgi:hypothetical protein